MLRDEVEKPWREAKKTLGKVGILEYSHLLSTQKALHGAPRAAFWGISNCHNGAPRAASGGICNYPTEHQELLS